MMAIHLTNEAKVEEWLSLTSTMICITTLWYQCWGKSKWLCPLQGRESALWFFEWITCFCEWQSNSLFFLSFFHSFVRSSGRDSLPSLICKQAMRANQSCHSLEKSNWVKSDGSDLPICIKRGKTVKNWQKLQFFCLFFCWGNCLILIAICLNHERMGHATLYNRVISVIFSQHSFVKSEKGKSLTDTLLKSDKSNCLMVAI